MLSCVFFRYVSIDRILANGHLCKGGIGSRRVMIERSPSKSLDTTEMRMYEYALNMWYDQPVAVVNRRLVEAGVRPLTKNVDGYDENGIKMA